jgi:hypothetical protein
MRTHLWIPDTQVRSDVNTDHIEACGNYILDKRPDVVVIAGDWWDMPSLSSYANSRDSEGMRIADDLEAGQRAMAKLWKPLRKWNQMRSTNKKGQWWPEVHFLMGNHEERIQRFLGDHPKLVGLLGYDNFGLDKYNITVHDYLKIVSIDGISYCHYFKQPNSKNAYTGMIETRLKNIGFTFTQGHAQSFAYGERELANGKVMHGLVAGAFYSHDEGYRVHGNGHFRGVIMKHEVRDGMYDLMKVSLNFLTRRYL